MKNISQFIGDLRPFLKNIFSTYDRVWVTRRRKFDSELMFSAILSQTLDRDSNYRILYDRILESNVPSATEFSASSYSKARRRMPFEIFTDVSQWIYKFHEIPADKKWLGMNVFAIDSTLLDLPKELEEDGFECLNGDESTCPQGFATVLFDLQKGMIYDSILSQHLDERINARFLLKSLPDNSLMICDRNYKGFDFLYEAEAENVKVLIRMPESTCPQGLQDFIDSECDDEIITVTHSLPTERKLLGRGYDLKPITVRAIKYFVGDIRFIAVTTLLDEEIPKTLLASLYWCRWDIEECFKMKKDKLKLENFRSKHLLGVLQEFWAMQLLINFGRALAICKEGLRNKLKNRVEFSNFAILKILRIHLFKLLNCKKRKLDEGIARLEKAFEKIKQRFRPGRHFPRYL